LDAQAAALPGVVGGGREFHGALRALGGDAVGNAAEINEMREGVGGTGGGAEDHKATKKRAVKPVPQSVPHRARRPRAMAWPPGGRSRGADGTRQRRCQAI